VPPRGRIAPDATRRPRRRRWFALLGAVLVAVIAGAREAAFARNRPDWR
jgi:hypothetical protein